MITLVKMKKLVKSNFKKLIYIIIFFSGILDGCTEMFEPPSTGNQKILVVDGLITNVNETYQIRLFYASSNGSDTGTTPVTQAKITINDGLGEEYGFNDLGNGTYVSNQATFTGTVGRTYTLVINTIDGNTYQSAPQLMEPSMSIDSIYGEILNKNYQGVDNYVNIDKPSGYNCNIRFTDSLLIEAVSEQNGMPPKVFYSWYYAGMDQDINITGSSLVTNNSNIVDHELCFFPLYGPYYYIPDTQSIYRWILTVRAYSINNDTYNIYNLMNEQLNTGNQLFTPAVTQITGNITCTSNPSKPVLGKFEASSYTQSTYIVIPNLKTGLRPQYKKISNLGTIPKYSIPTLHEPAFWQ